MSSPASDPPLVLIDAVSFGYDAKPLLREVSIAAPRGSVVALMGGSGSGKTTLLRLISGQLRPDAGRVMVEGQDVAALDRPSLYRFRRRTGMLFQFGALFTDLSVFDNVAFPYREQTNLPEAVIRDLVLMKLEAVGLRGAAQSRLLHAVECGRRAAEIGARAHPHLDHHACRPVVHDQIHLHPTQAHVARHGAASHEFQIGGGECFARTTAIL